MFRSIIACAAFMAALSAMPAAAQETDQLQIHVSYGDLNLATHAGQAHFKARIDQAVTELCGWSATHDFSRAAEVSRCRNDVWGRAQADVEAAVAKAKTFTPVLMASR